MAYWLMKSEPSEVSIDDVLRRPGQRVDWFGVRNYQARNYMMRDMQVGDGVLFYHSSCPQPGVAGLAEVSRQAIPDETQFDAQSPYYDPKATREQPRWYNVEVRVVKKRRCCRWARCAVRPRFRTCGCWRAGTACPSRP